MLEYIRTIAKTWVAQLILFLLSIPFIFWGIDSYIHAGSGQDAVATVGGEKISQQEFNNKLREQLDRFREQSRGAFDVSTLDTPEMRKSLLDQLIDQRLLQRAIKSSQLQISDNALRERLLGEPSLQENGQFSEARYEQLVKGQGYTKAGFESLLRKDLESQQFVNSVLNTGIVAKTSVQQYLNASEQSREVAIVNLPLDTYLPQVNITPEKVKAYYDGHQADFTVPEQMRVEYVELSADALAPGLVVKDEDIKKAYESNLSRYVQKEERKARHILISVMPSAKDDEKKAAKAKADEIISKLRKKPQDFPALAKQYSQDPGSAQSGGDLGFFGRGAMVAPFEAAAFSAKPNDVIGPVLSDFGYHIIQVTDIRPEKIKTVAEAKPEIEGELKKQLAQRKFAELAEKFSNAAYEQSTDLKAASAAVDLPIKQSNWISKAGGPPPFNNPKLTRALFTDEVIKNKRNTEAVEIASNSLVAARLLELKPAQVRPFSEVEASIRQFLTREEAGQLAKKAGEAKLAELKAGKATDIKFPALLAVSRRNSGGLSQAVIEAAMKAPVDKLPVFLGVENPNAGYVLLQVASVVASAAADETKIKAGRERLNQSVTGQELQSIIAQLRAKTDVSIVKSALEKKAEQ